jgi:hypothetical protein
MKPTGSALHVGGVSLRPNPRKQRTGVRRPPGGRPAKRPILEKTGSKAMSTAENVKKTSQKDETAAADLAGGGNIDKIREILFGVQLRESDKKFARVEERLLKESSDLREEIKKRFDALEIYVKKEVESLTSRLKSEQEERADADKEGSRELKEFAKTTEKKLSQIDDQAAKSNRDLRQQILDQSKVMTDEIRQKTEQISALLERRVQELRTDKADRTALASLFTEVAVRLNDEFRLPEKK